MRGLLYMYAAFVRAAFDVAASGMLFLCWRYSAVHRLQHVCLLRGCRSQPSEVLVQLLTAQLSKAKQQLSTIPILVVSSLGPPLPTTPKMGTSFAVWTFGAHIMQLQQMTKHVIV